MDTHLDLKILDGLWPHTSKYILVAYVAQITAVELEQYHQRLVVVATATLAKLQLKI